VLAVSWPLPARIALLVALAFSLPYSLLHRPRIVSLRLYEDGALECLSMDGAVLALTPLPETTIFPWLVVLRLETEEERKIISLTLFPDSMSREEFRILRLWLRWGTGGGRKKPSI
jgi:hypothetical protein